MVPDDEADIGDKLRYCIQEVVKPYRRLKTEEEKRVFKKFIRNRRITYCYTMDRRKYYTTERGFSQILECIKN